MSQRAERARVFALWDALVARLNADPVLAGLLRGGASFYGTNAARDRVYMPDATFRDDDGAEGTPWGRGIWLPGVGIVGTGPSRNSASKIVRGVLRFDVNDYPAEGWAPYRALERFHIEAYRLLNRWRPTTLAGVRLTSPVVLARHWEAGAQRDDVSGMWWLSAEYQVYVTSTMPA